MGKRYYCDYCDVTFPDSKEGRKKHNAGLVHQKIKESHFRQCADARTRFEQEAQKTPCRMFMQGLQCRFGDDCRFSHLQPHELDYLKYCAEMESMASKLPSQLKKEVRPIEEFVHMVESLVKKREAESINSKAWECYEVPLVAEDNQKTDAELDEEN